MTGPQIEIVWGGKLYRFADKAAALGAGFHIDDGPLPPQADQREKKVSA